MSTLNRVFDVTVRPLLPPKRVTMGGVDCFAGSVLDRSLVDDPEYEREMRAALREHVTEGDVVRVVGGGFGVTAVVAIDAGAERVEVVEATIEGVDRCERTLAANGVASRATVHHGTIGEVREAWGTDLGEPRSPEWCRECDVLELDCEGAERDILDALDPDGPLPGVLLAESHGHLGTPTAYVRERLDALGYQVVSEEYEDAENDVAILAAVHPPSGESTGGEL